MEPSWAPGLKALVRRHRYDFAAAAAEVGATAKELRVELARQISAGQVHRLLHLPSNL